MADAESYRKESQIWLAHTNISVKFKSEFKYYYIIIIIIIIDIFEQYLYTLYSAIGIPEKFLLLCYINSICSKHAHLLMSYPTFF